MDPQLADYDYVVVNTSSGKDSQTILLQTVTKAQREGFPKDHILCAHADLGRMEWPGTVELARQQAQIHGVSFTAIARPQGDLLTHIRERGMWPSSKARYCTSDHKRGQIRKVFTQAVSRIQARWRSEGKPQRQVRILNIMGMRAEESPARAKLQPFAHDAAASNGKRHVDTWLAIHDWKLPDVWKSIKASNVPFHKAYSLGMPRLSCVFCIFSPPAALMIAGRHNPELLADYVAAETAMGHTFRKDFPIASVQQAIARGEDWGAASDWVM